MDSADRGPSGRAAPRPAPFHFAFAPYSLGKSTPRFPHPEARHRGAHCAQCARAIRANTSSRPAKKGIVSSTLLRGRCARFPIAGWKWIRPFCTHCVVPASVLGCCFRFLMAVSCHNTLLHHVLQRGLRGLRPPKSSWAGKGHSPVQKRPYSSRTRLTHGT